MVDVQVLDQIAYDVAWELQRERVAARAADEIRDQLLLLEHTPVYTLGRSGREEHLLLDEAARAREGIAVYHVDRGGDITYHGPGQLVGYPILDLKALFRRRGAPRPDLHCYLRDLEAVIIETLTAFGVRAWRYEGYTGVWVDVPSAPGDAAREGASAKKIAAIGVKVSSRGISSHGFALNVDPNLAHFEGIIPCGIREHGVTSLAKLLGRPVVVTEVIPPLVDAFCAIFDATPQLVVSPIVPDYNHR